MLTRRTGITIVVMLIQVIVAASLAAAVVLVLSNLDWFSAPLSHIQRDREGKGWADMKAATTDITITGKGGRRRA
jgi:hypothetical protein